MPFSAVALMTGAPSAAYAQCFGSLNAIVSSIGTINTAFLPGGSAFLSSPKGAPDQQSGGVWTRGVGGTVDTQADSNFSVSFSPANGPGPSFGLIQSCRASTKQNFAGFEAGHDIAVLNTANSDMNWHFGVLAGYVGVRIDTPSQGGIPGQTIDDNAPSAGLYTAFTKGNLSADVQARLYDIQSASLGQRTDARGYSLAGNVNYRFDLPGNWSLEPSIGGIFSRTSTDPLTIAALPIPAGPTFAVLSGTQQFQDIESALGRAGVRLGTSFPLTGGMVLAYPFVAANVFHEFEGSATTSIAAIATVPGASLQYQGGGTLTASGVGTYGQFGGGSVFQLANTGWLGFARLDYRTGDNIQGYSVIAGLRYQFEGADHVAENRAGHPEMAVKARRAEGYDWTGPYLGVSAGSTWGGTHFLFQGAAIDPDYAGVLAGGQAGYNFQRGQFVAGIEADGGASNARGAGRACPVQPQAPFAFGCEDDVGVLGSLTGRLGYTWGRALVYTKGGWAFGQVTAGTALNFVDPFLQMPPAQGATKSTNWENGWTVGGGMEFVLTDRWSAKAEYMHYEFPQYAFTVVQNATANVTTAGDIVRIGANYHIRP